MPRGPVVLGRPLWAWLCAATAAVLLIWTMPVGPFSDPIAATWVLLVTVPVSAGLVLMGSTAHRRNGALMVIEGALLAATQVQWVPTGPWQQVAYVLYPVSAVPLALLLLRWPAERLQTRVQLWFVRCSWAATIGLGLLDALTWDPWPDGRSGGVWWLTVVDHPSLNVWIYRIKQGALVALILVFLALLAQRVLRAARPDRRALLPVVVAAVAFAVTNGADLVLQIITVSAATITPLVLSNLAVLVIPVSALMSLAIRRVQRALAVEALLEPARLPDPESVRLALARALGDRGLTLALWSPARADYLSTDGVPVRVDAQDRFAVDVAAADGSAVARIGVDRRLAHSGELLESLARAAGVALDNARLQAELRARQRETAESSRRLAHAERIERSLSRLVPGGVARRLRDDPDLLARTERLTVTVLMSDIRGYSTIAEATPAAELADQLNEHRAAMNAVILGEGGTVMQYVGDAVLAVFGAPDPRPDHGLRALRAAAAMHSAQENLNATWANAGRRPFGLGIGLCTGEVAAAFLGSQERVEYTVVGDTVNLAARLTDAARPAGTTIASAATVDLARGEPDEAWQGEALPPFHVKGRVASVSAFRIRTSVTAQATVSDVPQVGA